MTRHKAGYTGDCESCYSAASIAAKLRQRKGVQLSPSSTARILLSAGYKHMKPQQIPLLTDKHKAERLTFATELKRVN
ncbi:MAG: hypothetical protein EOP10_23165 [Proteobacteria bacterium]|nr:MAG: hypothetical protein EOP10_23165 [Pseudomonadota bacterium]